MSYSINEARSNCFDMNGFEIESGQGFKMIPKGKIFFGGFNIIDEENGSFTLKDQDFNESWKIEAKSLRSLKLKLNKVSLESENTNSQVLRYSFKKALVVSREKWNAEILKHDQAVQKQLEAVQI